MLIILDIALLIFLIKLVAETGRPQPPALIFSGYQLMIALLLGAGWLSMLISAGLAYGLSYGWFALLSRADEASGRWWLIVCSGIVGWFLIYGFF